ISVSPQKNKTNITFSETGVSVQIQFEDALHPGQYVDWFCQAEVRLDVRGDQSLFTPSSGAWVPCNIPVIQSRYSPEENRLRESGALPKDTKHLPGTANSLNY